MAAIKFKTGNGEATDIRDRIFTAYQEAKEDRDSMGLGASQAGKACDRQLWYNLRWAYTEVFEGRMLRLFQTGHIEEARVVKDLRAAGYEVEDLDPETGEQFRANALNGWLRGKTDGLVSGPFLPKGKGLLEVKSHNENSFKKLRNAAGGVRFAKPEHFIQMQIYMHVRKLKWCLYVAVNKNDDDIYPEIVNYDLTTVEVLADRIKPIIVADLAPPRAGKKEDDFTCKFCPFVPVCWQKTDARKTCRSCIHATMETEGPECVVCELKHSFLTKEEQLAGCGAHVYNPAMVAAKLLDGQQDPVTGAGRLRYEKADGTVYEVEVPGV